MNTPAPVLPFAQREFQGWRNTATLCKAGRRDEALVLFVSNTPFACPGDAGVCSIAEKGSEDVILLLDSGLLWCQLPRLQAERIVRLLRSGQLSLHVHTFQPNSPDVLTGHRAQLMPLVSLSGLPPARHQPAEGFKTPHHLRATLSLGPNADLLRIRRLITQLGG
jgi:hypothetical protein